MDEEEGSYAFMIAIMCNNETEVAQAMEKLNMVLVGLCLDGINVSMMRLRDDI